MSATISNKMPQGLWFKNSECFIPGHHKLKFFVHKISCMQHRFRCMSVHMGDCARKRADMGINNNMIQWY